MIHQGLPQISLRNTGLIRATGAVERMAELQELADKQLIEAARNAPTYATPVPIISGLEWSFGQCGRKPCLRRLPNWRLRLFQTLDEWSGYKYWSGRRCCFGLACASIDAMCGTKAEAENFGGWDGIGNLWAYFAPRGGRDYFDKWGVRSLLGKAKTGDVLQFEERRGDKACFHWAIVADDAGKAISFEVNGLNEIDIGQFSKVMAVTRCWSIG